MEERNLIGYGRRKPFANWPDHARVAVQFVLNIEEGAESGVLNGDTESESYLHELPGRPARTNERDLSVESMYEYGSRAGVWRILDLFRSRGLPLTAFAAGRALEACPEVGRTLSEDGHEVAGHGYRWLDYRDVAEAIERDHIRLTVEIIERTCGKRPVGWYTGRVSANTRRLLEEEGGFLYSSDAYNDDLPYFAGESRSLLVIPYSLVTNDVRYLLTNGFATADDFYRCLKNAFDVLWNEGEVEPKLMTIGLHSRISGHPARAIALVRFLDFVTNRDKVWVCRREDVARHWLTRGLSDGDP